jgi:uncharacterized protein involved in response to NO
MINLQEKHTPSAFSLFNLGFRPFFLGGALSAALLIGLWLVIYSKGYQPNYYNFGIYWHAHEMLFGFSLAIIAGFLLTAVRTWTSVQTPHGWPLAGLFILWVVARILPIFSGIPDIVIAVTDLAFAPLVAIGIGWPIVRSGNFRNLIFIPLLVGFFIANLFIHLELLQITEGTANQGIQLALFLVMVIISLIGGRVIPFFTERGVEGVQCRKFALIEKGVIPLSIIWIISSFIPFTMVTVVLSLTLFILHGVRLAGWFKPAILKVPLVWILQLGYGFLVLGFGLYCLSLLEIVSQSIAFHAFAAGAIGSLTLGMMARVSLGHTARPLKAAPIIICAFVLMALSALIRVTVGWLPLPDLAILHLSGSLWIVGWLLFFVYYLPILVKPRIDGVYG